MRGATAIRAISETNGTSCRIYICTAGLAYVPHVLSYSMILQFLVPVKLIMGIMPIRALLQEYQLEEYDMIAQAIRQGNVHLFDQSLEMYQEKFFAQGTMLLMHKLRPLVLRTLLKHVVRWRAKKSQLNLIEYQRALQFVPRIVGATDATVSSKFEMDPDSLECLVANMIFKGYVNGKVSQKINVLVLSKSNPFPSLADIA